MYNNDHYSVTHLINKFNVHFSFKRKQDKTRQKANISAKRKSSLLLKIEKVGIH